MIVKLKCVEKCEFEQVTSGMEYEALVDKNVIYVIRDDDGYFKFIDASDILQGKWEVVSE